MKSLIIFICVALILITIGVLIHLFVLKRKENYDMKIDSLNLNEINEINNIKNVNKNLQQNNKYGLINWGGVNDTVNAYVWNSQNAINDGNITFPELSQDPTINPFINGAGLETPNIYGVSIANSGGGSRAFTSSVGYFRGLVKMGYDRQLQYVSTVSGGSWFYGMFSYMQSPNYLAINPNANPLPAAYGIYSATEVLGNSAGFTGVNIATNPPNPTSITIDDLNTQPVFPQITAAMLVSPGYTLSGLKESLLAKFTSHDWTDAISTYFLTPFGLQNLIPTLNENHKNSLIQRNINNQILLNSRGLIYLPNQYPFWICNATLFAKWGAGQQANTVSSINNGYLSSYNYVYVQQTPLYTGIPQIISTNNDLTFDTIILQRRNQLGGYVIESFAFGNSYAPQEQLTYGVMNLKLGSRPYPQSIIIQGRLSVGVPMPIFFQDFIATSSNALGGKEWHSEPIPIKSSAQRKISSKIKNAIAGLDKRSLQYAVPIYNMWGKYPEINTYNSKQCIALSNTVIDSFKSPNIYPFFNCVGKPGYNINSCTNYTNNICLANNANETDSVANFTATVGTQQQYDNLVQLSDGAFCDNTGVISLVARGVRKIICFMHTANVLSYNATSNWELTDIAGLFGRQVVPHENHYAQNTSNVFLNTDFDNVLYDLLSTSPNPTGRQPLGNVCCYSYRPLHVIPNQAFGVTGGYIAEVLFVILQGSNNFNNALPDIVQQQLYKKAKNFPNYKTALQNGAFNTTINLGGLGGPYGGPTTLTPFQINILSTYTEWCMWKLQPILNLMFANNDPPNVCSKIRFGSSNLNLFESQIITIPTPGTTQYTVSYSTTCVGTNYMIDFVPDNIDVVVDTNHTIEIQLSNNDNSNTTIIPENNYNNISGLISGYCKFIIIIGTIV